MLKEFQSIPDLSALCEDRFQYWSSFIAKRKITSVVEIGVWKGDFAEKILKGCPKIQNYFMIDPWTHLDDWDKPFNVSSEKFELIREEALKKTDFASEKLTEFRMTTKEACASIEDASLDFVYIDGDHTLRGITLDLLSIYSKVKVGGVIAGDDFSLKPWQHGKEHEPTLVFPFVIYFAEAFNIPVFSLGANQFALVKNPNVGYKFVDLTGEYKNIDLRSLR